MLAVYIDLLVIKSRMKSFNIVVFGRFDGLGIGNCCHCLEHCSVRGVEFVVKKRVHLL